MFSEKVFWSKYQKGPAHKKCNLKKIGSTGQTQTKQRRLCEDNAERIVKIKKNTICEHDYDDTIGDDDGCSPALEAGKAGSLGWPVTDPQLPGSPHVDHQDDGDDHHDEHFTLMMVIVLTIYQIYDDDNDDDFSVGPSLLDLRTV